MKLHVGCGRKILPGYVHVDTQPYNHVDHVCDMMKLDDIIKKDSVDEIYVCHALEHVPRGKAQEVLKTFYDILKEGGHLRVSVPDFDAVVKRYNENENNVEELQGLMVGGHRDKYDVHTHVFTFKWLKTMLKDVGFKDIKRYCWKEFLPEGFDDYSRAYLPHMDTSGTLMSLNVISTK
jgi:predicted SAM-dependent methyltransferase